jgi:hypothetical protein
MTNTQTQRITLDPGTGERADGQHFTCPDARNRFFAVGHAPQGGRHEMNGPVYSEPFAFVYGCAAVLTDGPENPMAKYAETIVRAGDVVEIKGYGLHRVDRDLDGYNLKLTKVADEDETPEPELDLARVTRQIERLRELGQTDSDEYPRLIGRAARLRHLVAVMRRDARDSERIAASDPFAEPEARSSVHDVSLGAAGLTARPAERLEPARSRRDPRRRRRRPDLVLDLRRGGRLEAPAGRLLGIGEADRPQRPRGPLPDPRDARLGELPRRP